MVAERSAPEAAVVALQNQHLLGLRGVAHVQLKQEAVELGFGQAVRALLLNGVLGGEHHKGRGHFVGRAVLGYGALLHHLKQGRLRFGRGTVDFVNQHHAGENGAGPKLELAPVGPENTGAQHVGRHQVGGELDAAEGHVQGAGQQLGGEGFGHARYAFQQHVPIGKQGREQQFQQLLLAHNDAADALAHGLGALGEAREVYAGREAGRGFQRGRRSWHGRFRGRGGRFRRGGSSGSSGRVRGWGGNLSSGGQRGVEGGIGLHKGAVG